MMGAFGGPAWYTVPEVAMLLGVSKSYVYEEIASGRMRRLLRRGNERGFLVSEEMVAEWRRKSFEEAAER